MSSRWLREERADLAAGRLVEAAGRVFAGRGVRGATMADVAAEAGCSRATLYSYFPNRRSLQVAFVERGARDIAIAVAARLADVTDPATRLVEGVEAVLAEVRAAPGMAVWFTSVDVGVATEISSSSEVLDTVSDAFLVGLGQAAAEDRRAAARWLVRVVVSLLSMPAADAAEERGIIERFVVPSLLEPPR